MALDEGQIAKCRWENYLNAKAALYKRLLLFYGPGGDGRGKEKD